MRASRHIPLILTVFALWALSSPSVTSAEQVYFQNANQTKRRVYTLPKLPSTENFKHYNEKAAQWRATKLELREEVQKRFVDEVVVAGDKLRKIATNSRKGSLKLRKKIKEELALLTETDEEEIEEEHIAQFVYSSQLPIENMIPPK